MREGIYLHRHSDKILLAELVESEKLFTLNFYDKNHLFGFIDTANKEDLSKICLLGFYWICSF